MNKRTKPIKYSANFGWMLKHVRINNSLSFIKKVNKVYISLTLSRGVEMIRTSKYENKQSRERKLMGCTNFINK